jgi:hypothetical protein
MNKFDFFIGRVTHTTRVATLGLPPYRVFTLDEIEDATDNFDQSNLIGEGSQGQVRRLILQTVCGICMIS